MSEKWTKPNSQNRRLLASVSIGVFLVSVVSLIAFNEWRIRTYVGEPWTSDKPAVLETMNDIKDQVIQGSRERKQVFEKLQAIDQRVEQFEKKVIVILREDGSYATQPKPQ